MSVTFCCSFCSSQLLPCPFTLLSFLFLGFYCFVVRYFRFSCFFLFVLLREGEEKNV